MDTEPTDKTRMSSPSKFPGCVLRLKGSRLVLEEKKIMHSSSKHSIVNSVVRSYLLRVFDRNVEVDVNND